MTCPNCGAGMSLKENQEYLVCSYCGSMHFPDPNAEGVRVLEEPSNLQCPICAVALVQAAIGGERMLYCRSCRGMLLSMETFPGVLQNLRSRREPTAVGARPADPRDLERRICCPKCGQTMETHPYGGPGNVILDNCERCELNWLDYNELDSIIRAPDRQYFFEVREASEKQD